MAAPSSILDLQSEEMTKSILCTNTFQNPKYYRVRAAPPFYARRPLALPTTPPPPLRAASAWRRHNPPRPAGAPLPASCAYGRPTSGQRRHCPRPPSPPTPFLRHPARTERGARPAGAPPPSSCTHVATAGRRGHSPPRPPARMAQLPPGAAATQRSLPAPPPTSSCTHGAVTGAARRSHGLKPGEPNQRWPRVTFGEEEDMLWQRPIRPKQKRTQPRTQA
ncbi:hypothetical protein U9M48_004173 [Paspalum notatum var. saurae]|uniref:Uncharacterized protein n=1 Tax=Paspalum notatum var. saurae TaxID=547442 RepID=A0AAQ3PLQ5_PASNO